MNQFQNPKGQNPASPTLRFLQAHPSIGKDYMCNLLRSFFADPLPVNKVSSSRKPVGCQGNLPTRTPPGLLKSTHVVRYVSLEGHGCRSTPLAKKAPSAIRVRWIPQLPLDTR
jgi:hypothetical protein